jgi:glycosyltransferase involved in cell wall biosynthesis
MQSQVKISVLTSTWNRGHLLERVWESLRAQTFKDFEWVVVNDGSEDNTVELVRGLGDLSDFDITLINASLRVGKSCADNRAIDAARGNFIVLCDSDDAFEPKALEILMCTWEGIPVSERRNYCGVTALCGSDGRVLGNRFYENERLKDIVWNELYTKLGSDLVIFTRAELLRNNKFPEVDYYISESSVWSKIGVLQTRFNPLVLQRKYYKESNSISFSGHMSFNRGHAYALAITRDYVRDYLSYMERLRRFINYFRYCVHGDIALRSAISLWMPSRIELLALLFILPISMFLSTKDRLERKVRKTHIDFLISRSVVTFQIERFKGRIMSRLPAELLNLDRNETD